MAKFPLSIAAILAAVGERPEPLGFAQDKLVEGFFDPTGINSKPAVDAEARASEFAPA